MQERSEIFIPAFPCCRKLYWCSWKICAGKETVRGFKAIDGEMDEYPEAAFFNVGTIDEVVEKAKASRERYMTTFWLKVIASDHVFYNGNCEALVVPAHDGEVRVSFPQRP